MKFTEYTLTHPQAPTLTLALVADLHCHPTEKALSMLRKLSPDLILSSGDMMHNCKLASVDAPQNLPGLTFLRQAAEVAPVYLSVGNHEGGMQAGNAEILASGGITLLDNRYVHTHGLVLGGLTSTVQCGYRKTEIPPLPDMDFLARFVAEKGFHVLLNHHPEFWSALLCGTGIELTLSGHAHGGQWHLFGRDIWSPGQGLFPRYASGKHVADTGETLVVSRGMTNTVAIPRFGNPTEIVVVRLQGDKS